MSGTIHQTPMYGLLESVLGTKGADVVPPPGGVARPVSDKETSVSTPKKDYNAHQITNV